MALLTGLLGPAFGIEPAGLVAGFGRSGAVLETSGRRCLWLDVYRAETPRQREQGLMFVTAMGEFEGMWFGYGEPVVLSMWMKNTRLPLDMLFIDGNGRVASVAAQTPPESTALIGSGGPVIGVLEVNADFARRWGVRRGDRLRLY